MPLGLDRTPATILGAIRWSGASSSGMLPIARRDVERLQQMLALQPRLTDIDAPVRAQRGAAAPLAFREAITWLEIHGDRPDVVAHWRRAAGGAAHPQPTTSRRPTRAYRPRVAAGAGAAERRAFASAAVNKAS